MEHMWCLLRSGWGHCWCRCAGISSYLLHMFIWNTSGSWPDFFSGHKVYIKHRSLKISKIAGNRIRGEVIAEGKNMTGWCCWTVSSTWPPLSPSYLPSPFISSERGISKKHFSGTNDPPPLFFLFHLYHDAVLSQSVGLPHLQQQGGEAETYWRQRAAP